MLNYFRLTFTVKIIQQIRSKYEYRIIIKGTKLLLTPSKSIVLSIHYQPLNCSLEQVKKPWFPFLSLFLITLNVYGLFCSAVVAYGVVFEVSSGSAVEEVNASRMTEEVDCKDDSVVICGFSAAATCDVWARVVVVTDSVVVTATGGTICGNLASSDTTVVPFT